MKKRILAGLMVATMAMSLAACGNGSAGTASDTSSMTNEASSKSAASSADATSETSMGGLKIGCAIQTLSNQVWAQEMEAMEKDAKADGNELTVVDCNENANTQIDQLENFITSGMDAIVVNPVDPDAIEEVCKQARDAGVLVFSWDEEMENSDINWLIENYDLGAEIGTQAAEWINKTFDDGACEVVVLGYPQTPILLERENGIIDKLAELAPNAEVVANQPAIDTTEGLNAMETILQAHPNVKVVCCIGGGGAAGANEALKGFYGDEIPEDVGIFSTDLTDETVASMQNGEFNKMCVAITGNAYVCGDVAYDLVVRKASGEKMEKNIYRDLIPVTIDNLDEMIAE